MITECGTEVKFKIKRKNNINYLFITLRENNHNSIVTKIRINNIYDIDIHRIIKELEKIRSKIVEDL